MSNTTGSKFGGRTVGTPNKLTKEVKETLQDITDEVVNSIEIQKLNTNQKLKFLQISLQYLLPRLKHTYNEIEEPISHTVNIVRTTHELDRLKKVEKYEEENNVKIL